jgi:hypothetical protein
LAGDALLEREDVVEDALNPSPLEPVVGDEAGHSKQLAQLEAERCVDPELTSLERLLQEHQALVEDLEPLPSVQHLFQRL